MNAAQLQIRLKNFAYSAVVLCESLPSGKTPKFSEAQLLPPAFSVAIHDRACKTQSPDVFAAKLNIAFEEIHETLFWLRAMADIPLIPAANFEFIVGEAVELTRILVSSAIASEKKSNPKY